MWERPTYTFSIFLFFSSKHVHAPLEHATMLSSNALCRKVFLRKSFEVLKVYGQSLSTLLSCLLLSDHFQNAASNENMPSCGTRNITDFAIKASYFENQGFAKVASTQYVCMLVLSTLSTT